MKIIFGDDRAKAERDIKRILGEDYEVFEGENLSVSDLPSLFFGTSLFGETRKILIKDLGENKECFEKLGEYVGSSHKVLVWETKLDKRTALYKKLKSSGVEFSEYKRPEETGGKEVFDIFETAFSNGGRAIRMIERVENVQDPYMYFGLLVTQAIKKYQFRQGAKEKRVLKELSKLDVLMKTSSNEPWLLIKTFILRISSL